MMRVAKLLGPSEVRERAGTGLRRTYFSARIHWPFTMAAIVLAIMPLFALAQTTAPSPLGTPPAVSELDTYTKIIGAIITGVATLIGLPIVLLTYRKTRAEIAKLELEALALREKLPDAGITSNDKEGVIRISVSHSPNVTVQVLADPRFLAPLLLLVDFVFAWVLLTLAGYFLRVFGFPGTLALAILAAVLLLPIVKQIFRVRAMLRPLQTPEEVRSSFRQLKSVAYTAYGIVVVVCGGFAALLFTASSVTELGHYAAWASVVAAAALVLAAPFLKPRMDRYLLQVSGAGSIAKNLPSSDPKTTRPR
jgi:hypothetical protein